MIPYSIACFMYNCIGISFKVATNLNLDPNWIIGIEKVELFKSFEKYCFIYSVVLYHKTNVK